jgi:hypothetical protein
MNGGTTMAEYRTIAQLGSFDIKSNWLPSMAAAIAKREEYLTHFPEAMIQIIDGKGRLIEIIGGTK